MGAMQPVAMPTLLLDKYKFIGYTKKKKKKTIEYCLYYPVERKIFVSKYIIFLKKFKKHKLTSK
jgi:hypothetical protein